MLRRVLEVCVLQLVGQGPVAQKYMREAGCGDSKEIGMMESNPKLAVSLYPNCFVNSFLELEHGH